jgi:hypothetical protein
MIDIEIDKLTNSIENRLSGDVFNTEVLQVSEKDLKGITKKKGWKFDWKKQIPEGEVYKLVIAESSESAIQGLVCLKDVGDHIYLSLVESAPFNKGKDRVYLGVAGNLFAYACKLSFELKYDGFVAFHAKTILIEHYEKTLGAKRVGKSLLMFIDTNAAQKLINQYFKS